MPKRKMTPFARFIIVMLFIVPLAYFGASWYNGEDPLNVRQYLGLDAGGSATFLAEGSNITLTQSALVLEEIIGQFLFSKAEEGTQIE